MILPFKKKTIRPRKNTLLLFGAALFGGVFLLSILLVGSLAVINPPTWSWRIQRAVSPPKQYPQQVKHQWVTLGQISAALQRAVIASEDQKFPHHNGFDWQAMRAALSNNQRGKSLRGGSTLTQQTAKNLYLWPGRSYFRKALEAYFAFWMETLLSKARILEIYLNIVEFGPGVYGVEAASRHFFGRSAKNVKIQQASRLAVVLPNPYIYRVENPTPYLNNRARWVRRQMRQLGSGILQPLHGQ